MPFDESILDDVAKLSDDEALKFFEGLTPEERTEFDSALAVKPPPSTTLNSTVDRYVDHADYGQQMSVATAAPSPEKKPIFPPLTPGGTLFTDSGKDPAGTLKTLHKGIDTAVTTAQESIGRPLAETAIKTAPLPATSPLGKRLDRLFLSPIAGQGIKQFDTTPQEMAAGRKQLEAALPKGEILGISAADAVEGLVEGGGNIVNYTPLGAEQALLGVSTRLLSSAPTWAKIFGKLGARAMGNAVENVGQEALQLAGQSEVSSDEAKKRLALASGVGAIFGAGVQGGKEIFGKAPKLENAPLLVGDIPPTRLSNPMHHIPPQELSVLIKESIAATPDVEISGKDFSTAHAANSMTVTATAGPGGTIHAHIVNKDGTKTLLMLNTPKEAADFYQKLSAQSHHSLSVPPSETLGIDRDMYYAMMGAENVNATGQIMAWPNGIRGETAVVRNQDISPQPQVGALISATPEGPRIDAVIPLVPDRAPGDIDIGSRVVIDGPRGTPEIVGTIKSAGDGRYVVADDLGKKHTVDSYRVRAASEAEVLQADAMFGDSMGALSFEEKIVQAMRSSGRELAVKDVAALTGLDLEASVTILQAMESTGAIVKVGNAWDLPLEKPKSFFKTPEQPSLESPFKVGDFVYAKGRNGQEAARVVGIDANGKARLQLGKNSLGLDEFDVKDLRPTTPPGIAETKGVTPSQPILYGGPPTVDELKQNFSGEADNVLKLLKRMMPDQVKRALSGFLDARHRGPLALRHHIREVQATKAFEEMRQLEYEKIRRMFPNQKTHEAFDLDLDKAIRAKTLTEADALMEKYPAWVAVKDEAHKLIIEKQNLDTRYKELTGHDFDNAGLADTEGLIQQWVARRYWAFTNQRQWHKHAIHSQEIMDGAIAHIKSQNVNAFQTDSSIAQELRRILRADNPLEAYGKSGLNPYGKKSMFHRQDIPEPIRKLLGEHQSGMMNLAESLGTQRAVIHSLEAWDAITQDPRAFLPGPPTGPEAHLWKQLPDDSKKYGAAARGFVREEIWDAFAGLQEQLGRSHEWVRALTGWVKGNQVALGGLRPYWRSTKGNLDSSMAVGGISVFRPVEMGKTLKEAFDAIKAFRKDPTADGSGKIIYEAKKYGADWSGYASMEIKRDYDKALEDFGAVFGAPSDDALDIIAGLNKKYGTGLIKRGQEWGGGMMDLNDQIFRIANYIGLRRKFLARGMTPENAARAASERINKYFWNAQNVGRHVEKARQSAVGVAANYLTPYAEDMRTHINMARGFANEDTAYRLRMLAWHGIFYGTALFGIKGVNALLNNVSPEEMAEAERKMTKSSQTYKPLSSVVPFRDSNGNLQVFDFTPFSYPASLTAGNVDDPVATRIAANILTGPFSEAGSKLVRKPLELTGVVRPLPKYNPTMLEGEASAWKILEFMSDTSLVPQAPVKIIKDVNKLQGKTPFSKTVTPGQITARALGLPVESVPKTMVPRVFEFSKELKDAGKGLSNKDAKIKDASKQRIKDLGKQFRGEKK